MLPDRLRRNCFNCEARLSGDWCDVGHDALVQLNDLKCAANVPVGKSIFLQGNPPVGLHVVERGLVALRRASPSGESLIVALAHPGHIVGQAEFFSGNPHPETAEALVPSVVCFLERSRVERLLHDQPALWATFLRRMALDLRRAQDARLELILLPVRARVAALLLQLKERFGTVTDGGELQLELPLGRRDLAAMVGTRPETIARTLRALEDDNVARFSGRRVTIPDLDRLMDETEADDAQ